MIKDKRLQWTDQERLFVQACHEAISSTYGQLAKRTKEGEQIRFDKVNEKFRTGLLRCKSPNTFLDFIAEFWARAGNVPTLKQHWQDLMGLVITEWRFARDLALLSLASYKGKESEKQSDSPTASVEEELIAVGEIDDGFDEEE